MAAIHRCWNMERAFDVELVGVDVKGWFKFTSLHSDSEAESRTENGFDKSRDAVAKMELLKFGQPHL